MPMNSWMYKIECTVAVCNYLMKNSMQINLQCCNIFFKKKKKLVGTGALEFHAMLCFDYDASIFKLPELLVYHFRAY
jgi:hypothetical protein